MHPLDDFDAYLSRWIDELQKPDTKNDGGYTGGTCPFAKSAWDKNRIKVCKIYDYNETYDFWSVVGKELGRTKKSRHPCQRNLQGNAVAAIPSTVMTWPTEVGRPCFPFANLWEPEV